MILPWPNSLFEVGVGLDGKTVISTRTISPTCPRDGTSVKMMVWRPKLSLITALSHPPKRIPITYLTPGFIIYFTELSTRIDKQFSEVDPPLSFFKELLLFPTYNDLRVRKRKGGRREDLISSPTIRLSDCT